MEKSRKLFRSRSDRIISGVCGGLAKHLEVDSLLVRVIFVLLALVSGIGILIYLALALLVPGEDRPEATPAQAVRQGAEEMSQKAKEVAGEVAYKVQKAARATGKRASFFLGLILVVLGLWFLLENLGLIWPWWIGFDVLWPVLLILLGVLVFWRWVTNSQKQR